MQLNQIHGFFIFFLDIYFPISGTRFITMLLWLNGTMEPPPRLIGDLISDKPFTKPH